ncbi:MAG: hypothetical protein WBR32_21705, partial [Pseudolabrys sp.]
PPASRGAGSTTLLLVLCQAKIPTRTNECPLLAAALSGHSSLHGLMSAFDPKRTLRQFSPFQNTSLNLYDAVS